MDAAGDDAHAVAAAVSDAVVNPKRAIEAAQKALQSVTLSAGLRSDALRATATALMQLGDMQGALACLDQGIEAARQADDGSREARCWCNVGVVRLHLAEHAGALQAFAQCLSFVSPRSELAAMVCCNVGLIAEHLGFPELSLEFTEVAWSNLPDGSTKALAGVCSGAALCQLKRLDDARARLEAALAMLRADVSSIAWLDASSALRWVDAHQGHAKSAIPALRELVAIADASGLYSSSSRAREVLAEVYLMVSQPEEAVTILETAMPVMSSVNANVTAESCRTLARAYAALGRWQDAYELLAKLPAPFGATFAVHESFVLLRRLVLSSDSARPQETDAKPGSLNTQLAAGTTAIARRLGLTPADLRLVALLVDGKSNIDLAQSLGVSANTVRNRLARVMSKLGVRTRAAVVSKVVEAGLVIR